ncbi:MAG: 30S ribosomal protein S12 methylthiotransferase RimO [Clostridia bacterium]|nr:30S ribosomal protein S12 methylthiotransferase RimO [Clostridia bacterium]
MKIGVISLGCDKNRVDTEKMLARLVRAGHTTVSSENDADVIIINTCAFTTDAKQESVDETLSAVELKKNGKLKVIVTGCLTERYRELILEQIPEIDAILGISDYDKIVEIIDNLDNGEKKSAFCGCDKFLSDRVLTTPYHYAYLKIADGCSNHCTYCAIPSIRGDYRSETIENLLAEATKLADSGVKELILVAQDVTRFGIDFDGKAHLIELLEKLCQLDFEWLRLLYLEPEMVTDELIDYVASNPKMCKYMDVPLQHIDDVVLKRMNRHSTEKSTYELLEKLKSKNIAVRSSFIVGFPEESEAQYQKLYNFIREYELDYAGFFAYSREDGTPADKLDGHLQDSVKNERVDTLRSLQAEIIRKKNKKLVGKTVKVLYDDIDYEKQCFVGRTQRQTPEIDTVVRFDAHEAVQIGEFYEVEIQGLDGIDLRGKQK